ncbi:MAG: DUF3413 domain-containing protein, partial [Planctomycetes bacterium]|nr:DUF3413 domain-containing protein [Planctomycetota bacterium]
KLLFCIAIGLFTLIQLFIFTDKQIFKLYHFHINGFVWNLIITPGGIESMGNSSSTILSTVKIIAGFIGLQIALFFIAMSEIGQKISFAMQKIQFKKAFVGFIIRNTLAF